MTIAKGATVVVVTDTRERRGTVLTQVCTHEIKALSGETETSAVYRVRFAEGDGLPEHTGKYLEDQ